MNRVFQKQTFDFPRAGFGNIYRNSNGGMRQGRWSPPALIVLAAVLLTGHDQRVVILHSAAAQGDFADVVDISEFDFDVVAPQKGPLGIELARDLKVLRLVYQDGKPPPINQRGGVEVCSRVPLQAASRAWW